MVELVIMSSKKKNLLIIDDEENMVHMLMALLSRSGYTISSAGSGHEAIAEVEKQHFDFILCDVRMPGMDGLEFLKAVGDKLRESTVIMMSAYGSVELALDAMKAGAYDFISKPFKTDEVLLALKKAEEREALKHQNKYLQRELNKALGITGFEAIIGESKKLLSLIEVARKVSQYDTTVLITGESGAGKELVAKGIHSSSPRSQKQFYVVNCGSLPAELIESELFGHVKGAFTGADRNKKGIFEEASGSTLLLDEIGELPLAMQVKLLRVLQENEIRPVGANEVKKVEVRILAATAKNLETAVEKGTFREDLFYRLNVITLEVPPLRDRLEDVHPLCNHFIDKYNQKLGCRVTGVNPSVMSFLISYNWPGNIRQLENLIQRGVVLSGEGEIEIGHLPQQIVASGKDMGRVRPRGFSLKEAQKDLEAEMIESALEETGGNKSKAAQLLEISYPSLLSKIKEYGLG